MPRVINYDITITGATIYGPFTILDGQAAPQLLTSFPAAGGNNISLDYSIFRNGINRTGIALISSNGISSSMAEINTELADLGVELSAVINGANIEIKYTSTSIGFNGSFKYFIKLWS